MKENMIPIAKVGATHRLNGDLKLHLLTSSIEIALSYGRWYLQKCHSDVWTMLNGEMVSRLGSVILIRFDGITTKEGAVPFRGSFIGVPRVVLPSLEEDYFYWNDLIGLDVINESGELFGKVRGIIETGSNEVLICKLDNKEYLIPFANDYIIKVDVDKSKILTTWQYDYT